MPDLVEELDKQQLVRCIARFLQARGVQPRQQSRVIEEILGISYSHTHRLIRGDAGWTVPQLMQVARHYDVTLAEVIAPLLSSPQPIEQEINSTTTDQKPMLVPKRQGRPRKIHPEA